MENKFFNSKFNSVLLLILIVLMVVALYYMFQNKEVYLPSLSKEEIIETNEGLISGDNSNEDLSIKIGEVVILDSLDYFRYVDFVTKQTEFFPISIISKHLNSKNSSSFITKPKCGKTSKDLLENINEDESLAPCEFYLQDKDGKIQKIAEWPNGSLLKQKDYDPLLSYRYKEGSLRMCLEKVPYYCNNINNKFYFTSNSIDGCVGYIEEWSFDLDSKKFLLENKENYDDC
jgi:hypothetical protein